MKLYKMDNVLQILWFDSTTIGADQWGEFCTNISPSGKPAPIQFFSCGRMLIDYPIVLPFLIRLGKV
jgi:hypothetical protein